MPTSSTRWTPKWPISTTKVIPSGWSSEDKKMEVKHGKYEITFTATNKNVHIVDSYKITKKADMNAIAKLIRAEAKKLGYTYKRSNSSWVTEWRAHNYMYDKGMARSRTASVDLDECASRIVLASYKLMSALYRKG